MVDETENENAYTHIIPDTEMVAMNRDTYVVIPRFEEEPNGITAHLMPLVRRRGGVNSKQYY